MSKSKSKSKSTCWYPGCPLPASPYTLGGKPMMGCAVHR